MTENKTIDLEFYGTDGAVLILASWDEDEEHENPALEVEVIAKYFALKGGSL